MGCYIWYSEEGTGCGGSPPRLLLAVPNVTAHSSTASVPTSCYSMSHYNCLGTLKSLNLLDSSRHRQDGFCDLFLVLHSRVILLFDLLTATVGRFVFLPRRPLSAISDVVLDATPWPCGAPWHRHLWPCPRRSRPRPWTGVIGGRMDW